MLVDIGPYPDKGERHIAVEIDDCDIWSMDNTLAHIILPMLKKLQKVKHGSPHVDDEDVPEYIRSTAASEKENEWDTDEFFHDRWNWVMDEMIWAFEQILDDDNDSKFFTKTGEWETEELDNGNFRVNNTGMEYDKEGHTKHLDRIQRGTTLFGKYYRGLWD